MPLNAVCYPLDLLVCTLKVVSVFPVGVLQPLIRSNCHDSPSDSPLSVLHVLLRAREYEFADFAVLFALYSATASPSTIPPSAIITTARTLHKAAVAAVDVVPAVEKNKKLDLYK